jgi:DNA-binding FadR family transcriptional regulator
MVQAALRSATNCSNLNTRTAPRKRDFASGHKHSCVGAADIAALCTFRIVIEPKATELAFRHDRDGSFAATRPAIAAMEQASRPKTTLVG